MGSTSYSYHYPGQESTEGKLSRAQAAAQFESVQETLASIGKSHRTMDERLLFALSEIPSLESFDLASRNGEIADEARKIFAVHHEVLREMADSKNEITKETVYAAARVTMDIIDAIASGWGGLIHPPWIMPAMEVMSMVENGRIGYRPMSEPSKEIDSVRHYLIRVRSELKRKCQSQLKGFLESYSVGYDDDDRRLLQSISDVYSQLCSIASDVNTQLHSTDENSKAKFTTILTHLTAIEDSLNNWGCYLLVGPRSRGA